MPLEKSMGLLQKANLLSKKQGLAFCDFIVKNKIKYIAKFSLIGDYYFIVNSYGFDASSISCSKSTPDFWNGLIPSKNKIYNFSASDNNLNSLLQFFSFKLKDEIETVQIIRDSSTIFMICNTEIQEADISSLFLLTENYPSHEFKIEKNIKVQKLEINLDQGIEDFLTNKNLSSDQNRIFVHSLEREIANRLFFHFSNNNYFGKKANLIYNVVFTSKNEIDFQLLSKHIKLNLTTVLDESTKFIKITNKGSSDNYSDLIAFIKAE